MSQEETEREIGSVNKNMKTLLKVVNKCIQAISDNDKRRQRQRLRREHRRRDSGRLQGRQRKRSGNHQGFTAYQQLVQHGSVYKERSCDRFIRRRQCEHRRPARGGERRERFRDRAAA